MIEVRFIEGGSQKVKATSFNFQEGVLYLYGEDSAPIAAFPQNNVLSVRKTDS